MQEEKEEYIEADICAFLELKGASLDKIISEGFYDAKNRIYRRRKSRFSHTGISDIIGIFEGYYFAIEVKKPSEMKFFDKTIEELTEGFNNAIRNDMHKSTVDKWAHALDQRKFLDDKTEKGGIAFFASSIEDVRK